jgi:hypothetical protein
MHNAVSRNQYKYAAAGREDLTMMVVCLVQKLSPPATSPNAVKQIPLDFSTDLLDHVLCEIQLQGSSDMYLPLFKAGFSRLWIDLSQVPRNREIGWLNVVPFLFRLIRVIEYVLQFSSNKHRD